MLSYLTQIFSSNYQMLGIPSATNVIFHTTLNAHFAMVIRRSHTDQLPVKHLDIPDPSLPCEGGAGDGSTSSESYSLSLKFWFETILKKYIYSSNNCEQLQCECCEEVFFNEPTLKTHMKSTHQSYRKKEKSDRMKCKVFKVLFGIWCP